MTEFSDVAALAENRLAYATGQKFAAIIGETPSKGARSPLLWNAAFKAHGIHAEMLPIDIQSGNLERLLMILDCNPDFLGGAVAIPHKESVARWMKGRLRPDVEGIGAVNCLFRDKDGCLTATNTDGEGALVAFERRFGAVAGKSVLLLGLGGAGKAVAAYFRRALGTDGRLRIGGRSEAARRYAEELKYEWIPWPELATVLPTTDVLVNCTSVGTGETAGETPVSASALSLLPRHAAVYDVIYQPTPSRLLALAAKRGLLVLDGTDMNLEQAVLAYSYAAPQPRGSAATRAAMESAKRLMA